MSINILVERHGIRAQVSVADSASTRIPGVHKIHWYGAPTRYDREYFSLVHLDTGRALNKVPLTTEEADRLVDALLDCPIELDKVKDFSTAKEYYVDRLTSEVEHLAGRY